MKTKVKALKDLYNDGKCFTKGKIYEVNGQVKHPYGLIDRMTVNDLGEVHYFGTWWREFEIVE